jgi:hypothetical protein
MSKAMNNMDLGKPIKNDKDLKRCFRRFKNSLTYTKKYNILPLAKILYTGDSRNRYAEYDFNIV